MAFTAAASPWPLVIPGLQYSHYPQYRSAEGSFGSGAEVPPWSRERPLSGVKQTQSARKRTCRLECRLSGERTVPSQEETFRAHRKSRFFRIQTL
jgi:hypothetical protein